MLQIELDHMNILLQDVPERQEDTRELEQKSVLTREEYLHEADWSTQPFHRQHFANDLMKAFLSKWQQCYV